MQTCRRQTRQAIAKAAGVVLLMVQCFAPVSGEGQPSLENRIRSIRFTGGATELQDFAGDHFRLERGDAVDSTLVLTALDSLDVKLHTAPGFPWARTSSWTLHDRGGSRYDLVIELDSGPYAVVDRVEVSGAPAEYGERIDSVIETAKGDAFDAERWKREMASVLHVLEQAGHPFAQVLSRPVEPTSRGDTVGVIAGMTVQPGRRVRISSVELAGLGRTDPELAARTLGVARGDLYDPKELERARRRLLKSGWFSRVGQAELFRNNEGRFGALFQVEEGPVGEMSGAVGYLPEDEGSGLAGALDLRLNNVFGHGRTLAVGWNRDSEELASYRVYYSQPWILGMPLAFQTELSQELLDTSWVARQADLDLELLSLDPWSLLGGFQYRRVRGDSLAAGLDTLDYDLRGVRGAVILDTRDEPVDPHSGGYYRVWTEWMRSSGAGVSTVSRTGVKLQQIQPFGVSSELMISVTGREIKASGGVLPPAEWLRVGGIATIRGYTERTLTATRAAWANIEYRRRLGEGLKGFALYDIAALDRAGITGWKQSMGLGAAMRSGSNKLEVVLAAPTDDGFAGMVVHVRARSVF
jgi:outer membrane protein assembly factor BamA